MTSMTSTKSAKKSDQKHPKLVNMSIFGEKDAEMLQCSRELIDSTAIYENGQKWTQMSEVFININAINQKHGTTDDFKYIVRKFLSHFSKFSRPVFCTTADKERWTEATNA